MKPNRNELNDFLEAVKDSFLPDRDKETFLREAVAGMSQQLWDRFNDHLIQEIINRQEAHQIYSRRLDEEIDRYTGEYEKEKTVIDREMRAQLEKAKAEGAAAEQDRLWNEYQARIQELQAKLRGEVRTTSTTVLQEAVMATVQSE